MKKLEMKQMEMIEGGKFWGSSYECDTIYAPDMAGIMSPTGQRCCLVSYAFWIQVNESGCENHYY